jgi:hypothetical protein
MRHTKGLLAAVAAFATATGPGTAQAIQLTAAERLEVSQACRTGLPLIPVQSDYGEETGEYALPISEDGGEVNSAFILTEGMLRSINDCKFAVERIKNQNDTPDTTTAIS